MFKFKTPLGHWSTWLWLLASAMLCFAVWLPGFLLGALPGLIPTLGNEWQQKAAMALGLAGFAAKFIDQGEVKARILKLKTWLATMAKSGSGAVKKTVAIGGGAIGAVILIAAPLVQHFEGRELKPYRDIVNVLTVCDGHTGKDIQNKTYTPQECDALLHGDLAQHAQTVLQCSPGLADHPNQFAAFLSFDYNTGAYCGSTARKMVNVGDYAGACAQLDRWIYAGGKPVNGLIRRRASERKLCESGLQ